MTILELARSLDTAERLLKLQTADRYRASHQEALAGIQHARDRLKYQAWLKQQIQFADFYLSIFMPETSSELRDVLVARAGLQNALERLL